jgi:hypothetical protein
MNDTEIYEAVAEELERSGPLKGLWIKAMVCAGGDEESARPIYVELRKEQLAADAAAKAKSEPRGRARFGYWRLAIALSIGSLLVVFALDACAV